MTLERDQLAPLVRSALEAEHLYGCSQNNCDIRMSADLGYYFLAAEQLLGATEAPTLAKVLARNPNWRAWARAEFKPFARWYAGHTVECPGCGGFIRFEADQPTTTCDSCLTAVVRPSGRKES